MEEKLLDAVLVPIGFLVFGLYHVWLVITLKRNPRKTVIGLSAESHHQWVFALMADPLKNGVIAIQTLRNNMMASTLLATAAISLSSLIGVFVSNTSDVHNTSTLLVYGNKSSMLSSVKYFALIVCFLVAFLCNVQSMRYYAHVSFLASMPTSQGRKEAIEYTARCLNRGSLFWSLGFRAYYLSFPFFLWLFGPIPMFVCSCVMSIVLYLLDTTTSFTRQIHSESLKDHQFEYASPVSS